MRAFKQILGPIAGVVVALLLGQTQSGTLALCAGVAVWMALWWTTEAVSIYVTALLPIILFPVLGIVDAKSLAPEYMPDTNFLFLGGFIIAFALEKWNLHKRIALWIILSTGATPSRILFGFMLTSYLLSMWLMNTATVLMLLPAVLAVIGQLEGQYGEAARKPATGYLLGLAFASSIGGTATLVGTAPNMIFFGYFSQHFPDEPAISFGSWFVFGLPVSLCLFTVSYLVLKRLFFHKEVTATVDLTYCREEYIKLGPFSFPEKALTAVFVTTVLLWFTAQDVEFGDWKLEGWVSYLSWLPSEKFVRASTIAMAMALLLFLIPSGREKGKALMEWKDTQKIPYGILLLFGGGFALARGVRDSGLDKWIGSNLDVLAGLEPILLIGGLCLFMTFFTELTSNTASTILILPILEQLAPQVGISPYLLMMPVVFSASFAFMLPIATPPNTIVFGSEKVTVRDMMRAGIWLNLAGALLLLVLVFTLGKMLYG